MSNNYIFASIDVGSNEIRMKISDINKNREIKILESVKHQVNLGKDTFSGGKISFPTLEKTCEVLYGFKQLMRDYSCREYRAVATNAVREANNREYVLDQIKIKTGFVIDVISNSVERYLSCNYLKDVLPNYKKLREEGVFILDIGSGSTSISIYSENKLIYSHDLKLGSLRLHEILANIEGKLNDFPIILRDIIASDVDLLNIFGLKNIKVKNIIAIGAANDLIGKICSDTNYQSINVFKKNDFKIILEELLLNSYISFGKKYKIPFEKTNILLPSMIILNTFLDKTEADEVINPVISLCDGIISEAIDKKTKIKNNYNMYDDVVALSKNIAERFNYDKKHAEYVEKKSLLFFDKLRKLHGLKEKHRYLLKIAAILHDTGKFLSLNEHYIHSYELIKASDLIGISEEDLEIIANIARYHSNIVPDVNHSNFNILSSENRVIVAKLVAIIRIADSLDRSHKQRIEIKKIVLKDDRLKINIISNQNTLLEEWTFQLKAEFFQDVFGIKPILHVKRVL